MNIKIILGLFIIGFIVLWIITCGIIAGIMYFVKRRRKIKRLNNKLDEIKRELRFYKNEIEVQKGYLLDNHGESVCEIDL